MVDILGTVRLKLWRECGGREETALTVARISVTIVDAHGDSSAIRRRICHQCQWLLTRQFRYVQKSLGWECVEEAVALYQTWTMED